MDGARPDDLRAPLLHCSRLKVSSEAEVIVDIKGQGNGALGPVVESHNPFAFLGPGFISLAPPSPVDPFRNNTPDIGGLYEWLKIVVCIPIALLRLVVFGLALLAGYLATKLALEGWKDKQNPMPKWRCRIMWITRLCARCILFSFGYHWIKRVGKPATRENAPIITHDAIPFVGTIIRAMQVIYVNRFLASSRKHAVSEIKVEYLPVVLPLENRKESASQFAEQTFNVSTSEALEFLDKFLAMNPDSSGRVSMDGFFSELCLEPSPLAEKIFGFLDVEKRGSITFRQFLLGSAHVMKQPLFQPACAAAFDLRDAVWSAGEKNVTNVLFSM